MGDRPRLEELLDCEGASGKGPMLFEPPHWQLSCCTLHPDRQCLYKAAGQAKVTPSSSLAACFRSVKTRHPALLPVSWQTVEKQSLHPTAKNTETYELTALKGAHAPQRTTASHDAGGRRVAAHAALAVATRPSPPRNPGVHHHTRGAQQQHQTRRPILHMRTRAHKHTNTHAHRIGDTTQQQRRRLRDDVDNTEQIAQSAPCVQPLRRRGASSSTRAPSHQPPARV